MAKAIEKMGEDLAILKTEVVHMRADINKLLRILIESDHAIINRTTSSEVKIKQMEESLLQHHKNAFQIRIAVVSLALGLAGSIAVAMIEFWGRK